MSRKATDPDIIAMLTLHPSSCKDLARLLGMNTRYVSRRLKALVACSKITRHRLLQSDGRTPVYGVRGFIRE